MYYVIYAYRDNKFQDKEYIHLGMHIPYASLDTYIWGISRMNIRYISRYVYISRYMSNMLYYSVYIDAVIVMIKRRVNDDVSLLFVCKAMVF